MVALRPRGPDRFPVLLANTTTVGTTVTKTYTVTQTGLNSGMGINLSATSTSGSWLITNPGVFPPNCTIDRSAFAIDDNYVVAGTNTGGAVIPVFRYMSEFGGQSCDPNDCDASDLPPDDLDSHYVWYSSSLPASVPNVGGNLPSGTVTINYARFMNTNASSGTYAWSSPHLLSTCAVGDGRRRRDHRSALSRYDTRAACANDNGQIFMFATSPGGALVEFRCTAPHGLKTGQIAYFNGTASLPWTTAAGPSTQNFTNGGLSVGVTSEYTFFVFNWIMNGGDGTTWTINSTSEVVLSGFTCTLGCPSLPICAVRRRGSGDGSISRGDSLAQLSTDGKPRAHYRDHEPDVRDLGRQIQFTASILTSHGTRAAISITARSGTQRLVCSRSITLPVRPSSRMPKVNRILPESPRPTR